MTNVKTSCSFAFSRRQHDIFATLACVPIFYECYQSIPCLVINTSSTSKGLAIKRSKIRFFYSLRRLLDSLHEPLCLQLRHPCFGSSWTLIGLLIFVHDQTIKDWFVFVDLCLGVNMHVSIGRSSTVVYITSSFVKFTVQLSNGIAD